MKTLQVQELNFTQQKEYPSNYPGGMAWTSTVIPFEPETDICPHWLGVEIFPSQQYQRPTMDYHERYAGFVGGGCFRDFSRNPICQSDSLEYQHPYEGKVDTRLIFLCSPDGKETHELGHVSLLEGIVVAGLLPEGLEGNTVPITDSRDCEDRLNEYFHHFEYDDTISAAEKIFTLIGQSNLPDKVKQRLRGLR